MSHSVTAELAQRQGAGLTVGPRTIRKRLRDRGLLASWEPGRGSMTRRSCGGVAGRSVPHLRVDALAVSVGEGTPPRVSSTDACDGID